MSGRFLPATCQAPRGTGSPRTVHELWGGPIPRVYERFQEKRFKPARSRAAQRSRPVCTGRRHPSTYLSKMHDLIKRKIPLATAQAGARGVPSRRAPVRACTCSPLRAPAGELVVNTMNHKFISECQQRRARRNAHGRAPRGPLHGATSCTRLECTLY